MSSKVEICNLALGNIKANSINSLTEASLAAQVCNQRYQLALDSMLESFPWRFARKVTPLSLLAYEPNLWVYAYSYPIDCLKAHSVIPEVALATDRTLAYHFNGEYDYLRGLDTTFDIGQDDTGDKVILTNMSDAHLIYTAKVTNAEKLNATFVDALSWYLSSMIVIPLAGYEAGRKLREECLGIYQTMLGNAQALDANEQYGMASTPESPSIEARG